MITNNIQNENDDVCFKLISEIQDSSVLNKFWQNVLLFAKTFLVLIQTSGCKTVQNRPHFRQSLMTSRRL